MTDAAALVGGLLIAPVVFCAVELPATAEDGSAGSPGESPLDAKLEHVGRHNSAWWLMTPPWPDPRRHHRRAGRPCLSARRRDRLGRLLVCSCWPSRRG